MLNFKNDSFALLKTRETKGNLALNFAHHCHVHLVFTFNHLD